MKKSSKIKAKNDLDRLIEELKSLDPPRTDYQLYTLLKRLGLTKYEILAYIALVERGPQTISQLTGGMSKTGIPQPRAYDVMGSLVQYGLVEESTTASGKEKRGTKLFKANPPSEGLNNLMNFFNYAKNKAIQQLNLLEKSSPPFYGGIWEILNKSNIIRAIRRVISKCETEVLLVTDVEILEELVPTLKRSYNMRGILISTIIKSEKRDHVEEIFDWVKFMKLRYRRVFSMPYIIVDRKFAIQWSPQVTSAQEIENLDVIQTLIDHFFFSNWRIGIPIPQDNIFHKDFERKYPLSTVHIQTAIEEIEYLLQKQEEENLEGYVQNHSPILEIIGFDTKEKNSRISLKGEVVRTEANWNTGTFTIVIQSENKRVSVGGMLASLENITADHIIINNLEK